MIADSLAVPEAWSPGRAAHRRSRRGLARLRRPRSSRSKKRSASSCAKPTSNFLTRLDFSSPEVMNDGFLPPETIDALSPPAGRAASRSPNTPHYPARALLAPADRRIALPDDRAAHAAGLVTGGVKTVAQPLVDAMPGEAEVTPRAPSPPRDSLCRGDSAKAVARDHARRTDVLVRAKESSRDPARP